MQEYLKENFKLLEYLAMYNYLPALSSLRQLDCVGRSPHRLSCLGLHVSALCHSQQGRPKDAGITSV